MPEESQEYLKVARIMTDAAREAEFFNGTLEVIPEICEIEKRFFIALILELKRLDRDELAQDQLSCLFNFVSASAASAVCEWSCGTEPDFNFDCIFSAEDDIISSETVLLQLRRTEVANVMADAFFAGFGDNRNDVEADPLLTLLEALKWNWRITAHLALGAMESQ